MRTKNIILATFINKKSQICLCTYFVVHLNGPHYVFLLGVGSVLLVRPFLSFVQNLIDAHTFQLHMHERGRCQKANDAWPRETFR